MLWFVYFSAANPNPPSNGNSYINNNQVNNVTNTFAFTSPKSSGNDFPPPPSADRDMQSSSVRQPRRPTSNSFDSISSNDDDSDGAPIRSYLSQNSFDDSFHGPVSSDLFAVDSTEGSHKPDSPIEVLDDDEKWNKTSPPLSKRVGKSVPLPNHDVSFMPELLDDEPLDHDMTAFTPGRNPFGEVIGGQNSISPRFSPKPFKPNQLSTVDSQKAFDASFDAFVFPAEPLSKDVLSEPDSVDMKFSPSSGFNDNDPFFPSYDEVVRESNVSRISEKEQKATMASVSSTIENTLSTTNTSMNNVNSQSFFPSSPLDELDQIAMSSFGMKSPSMETNTGYELKGNDFQVSVPQDDASLSTNLQQSRIYQSKGSTKMSTLSASDKKVESVKDPPRSSSPRSPSSHSPSIVLRRIQQRRAQEKQEKNSKALLSGNEQGNTRLSESPSDENLSSDRSRFTLSPTDSSILKEEDLSLEKNSPSASDITSNEPKIVTPRAELSPSDQSNDQQLVNEFDAKAKVDDSVALSPVVKDGGKAHNSIRSSNASVFKSTHPNRPNKMKLDTNPSSTDQEQESKSPKGNVSNSGFSSIRDEIRRLDAIAMNSQSQSDRIRPIRRSVKQPVTYKEPSVSTKLRQGDVFFPKQEEREKEQARIPSQSPKSADEVLQDLADSSI